MNLRTIAATAVLSAVLLSACGGEEEVVETAPEILSSAIIDNNQVISKNNATSNARAYGAEMYPGVDVQPRFMSDSTVGKDKTCRYGDGWASGTIADDQGNRIDLKCQTNGSGKGLNGCLTDEDFATKDYAAQNGSCDDGITELPKL